MRSCERASVLTSISLDRKLTPTEFIGLWFHRALCGPCRAYRKQILAIHRGVQALGEKATEGRPLDAAARDRIRQRLREAQSPE